MKHPIGRLTALILSALLCNASANSLRAQQTQNPAQQPSSDDEILRISSDLVRLDVSILDANV